MHYTTIYSSPIGEILLACDDNGLIGLWFQDQKYFAVQLPDQYICHTSSSDMPFALSEGIRWLNIYFSGENPDFLPPLHLTGTAFRKEVWNILLTIPYGSTITYGEIASRIARQKNIPRMSAQAVGGAVGHNPLSIIVPCHRVVGSDGSLTGYAAGTDKKLALLRLEKCGCSPTKA